LNDLCICRNPWNTLVVNGNGSVRVCPYSKDLNISYDYTIDEIWNGDTLQRMRLSLLDGEFPPECKDICPKRMWSDERRLEELSLLNNKYSAALGIPVGICRDNIVRNHEEILERKTVLQSYPYYWRICFDMSCNIRCTFCFNVGQYHNSVSETTLLDMRNYYSYMYSVGFSGGEPTMSQEFWDMTNPRQLVENTQWLVHIGTNGLFMPEEIINRFAGFFDNVIISVRAGSKETYEKLQVGASWDKLWRNISALNDKIASIESRCRLTFLYVIMRSNYRELNDFFELAQSSNVKHVMLAPVQQTNKLDQELVFDNGTVHECVELREILESCKSNYGDVMLIENYDWILSKIDLRLSLIL